MEEQNIDNSHIEQIAKILNSNYERDRQKLDSLEKQLERAIESNASPAWIDRLSMDVSRMREGLDAQQNAASMYYNKMVEISGGRTDFDKQMMKDLFEHIKAYGDKLSEIAEVERQKELEKQKVGKDGKLSSRNLAEIQRLNDKLTTLDGDLKNIEETARKDIENKYGKDKNGNDYRGKSYAQQFVNSFFSKINGQESREALRGAMSGAKETAEVRNDERARAEAKKLNDEQLKNARDTWNTIRSIFNQIWGDVKKGANVWLDFNEQAIADAKRLGMTSKDEALAYTESLIEKTQTLSRNFAMTRAEAMKMQEAYAKTTGRASLLTQEQMEDIAAASKLMGQETVMGAIKMMDSMGTTSQTAVELLDSTYARARNAGIDIGKASEVFVQNLSLANKLNFRDGVDGISRMAIYSQKIKMDMSQIANAAEKFSTIEDAIENSAKLQVLGGAGALLGSNPMEMMFESLADPEAFQKRIGDMAADQAIFNRATGQSEIAPWQQAIMKEQAKVLGIDPTEFIQSAKQQAKIREIESDISRNAPQLRTQLKEDELNRIINTAQYDKETKRFFVNYYDKTEEKEKRVDIQDLGKLTQEQLDSITDQIEPIEDIRDNVREIAKELVGTRERLNSMKEQIWNGVAKAGHSIMTKFDKVLSWINSSKGWSFLTTTGMGALTFLGGRALYRGLLPKATRYAGRIWNSFFTGGRTAKPSGKPTTPNTPKPTPKVKAKGGNPKNVWKGDNWKFKRFNAIGKSKLSTSQLRNIAKMKNAAKVGAKSSGIAAGVISTGVAAYEFYAAGQEYKNDMNRIKQQSQLTNAYGVNRFSGNDIRQKEIEAENKKRLARGEAIGGAVGATAGAIAGGAIVGGLTFGLGTAVGAAIGGYLGDKLGRWAGKKLTPEKEGDMITEHIKEINKGDEEDNIKKIVLPVESIDYNVSLIANQLGIMSAKPARGNIYLEAEMEAVSRGEEPIQVVPLGGVPVNQVESHVINASDTYSRRDTIDLNVNGSINLNLNGSTIGKLTHDEIRKAIESDPSFMRRITEIVFDNISNNVSGGKHSKDVSSVMVGGLFENAQIYRPNKTNWK